MNGIIIKGQVAHGTGVGHKFRPSDWADRLAGAFATVCPRGKVKYHPEVQPIHIDGMLCIKVAPQFKENNPQGFDWLHAFAASNQLHVEAVA